MRTPLIEHQVSTAPPEQNTACSIHPKNLVGVRLELQIDFQLAF